MAWNIVRIKAQSMSKKRLVPLKQLLEEIGAPERQTLGQMRAALAIISQQHKLPMRKVQVH